MARTKQTRVDYNSIKARKHPRKELLGPAKRRPELTAPVKLNAKEKAKAKERSEDGKKVRAAHRFRSGTQALREIMRAQKNTGPCLRFKPLAERLFRPLAQQHEPSVRFTRNAIEVFRMALEGILLRHLDHAYPLALHAGRGTLRRRDLQLFAATQDATLRSEDYSKGLMAAVPVPKLEPAGATYVRRVGRRRRRSAKSAAPADAEASMEDEDEAGADSPAAIAAEDA